MSNAFWAEQINPRNGQRLAEGTVRFEYELWTPADAKRWPQASRQLTTREVLVRALDDDTVWAVDTRDLQESAA